MAVVVVESPAKAKTIEKYLGKGYQVLASYGHVRDLPSKDGSVQPDADFAMEWEMDARGAKRVREIAEAVKADGRLILATDPDREGEAISWHLLEALRARKVLKPTQPVERVTFNAITRAAVTEAMSKPRQVDLALVEAYLARRALDYLVGFNISPVLWRKLPGARSAGRVQSVALRLVVQREMEIEAFKSREYWTVKAEMHTAAGDSFEARLVTLAGQKLEKFDLADRASAERAAALIAGTGHRVTSIEAKPVSRNPWPPFTTSTLQQEASRKLGLSPAQTMRAAQRLYEGIEIGGETVGLITYMRTDGVDMAPEAVMAARDVIEADFGEHYVPKSPRMYKSKQKNAQEAHECIRPTDLRRHPQALRGLEPELWRLYDLIWKRTIASQMEAARFERTTVDFTADDGQTGLRATGQVVKFDGFLRLYTETLEDQDDEDGGRLPALAVGDRPALGAVTPEQHFTQPPPRYSEAGLIKRMEELGIGRPSTYATILSVLAERGYVRKEKGRLIPEDKGRLVTAFLENYFSRYVEYDFTAQLEEQLDEVSDGRLNYKTLLRDFWADFSAAINGTRELRISDVLDRINEVLAPHIFPPRADGGDPRQCLSCGTGRMSLKTGKFGAFIGCSNYPECRYTRPLASAEDSDGVPPDGKLLGHDSDGTAVTLRSGRFGPYVQLGEGEKPKRASIPKGMEPGSVDLARALALLALPRTVGEHPETGKPILAGIGRFGPYLLHDGSYANLKDAEEVLTIGVNRAVTVLAEKKSRGPGRGRATPAPLRVLGTHPEGGEVAVFEGRYGAYAKWGEVNATLPKGADPAAITLEDMLPLLAARAAMTGKKPAKTAAVKATTTKKTTQKATTKKAKTAEALVESDRPKRKPPVPPMLRSLGTHPEGGDVTLHKGGLFLMVRHNDIMAALPKGIEPEQVGLPMALAALARKRAKMAE